MVIVLLKSQIRVHVIDYHALERSDELFVFELPA